MARKARIEQGTMQWAMKLVDCARISDIDRPNLTNFNVTDKRVFATDGHRLFSQRYTVEQPLRGIVDTNGAVVTDGEYPDISRVVSKHWNIAFTVPKSDETMQALKAITKISDNPFGDIESDGDKVTVVYENTGFGISARIDLMVAGGAKPFKVGINLEYLYEALKANWDSGAQFATVKVADELCPVCITGSKGFFSITMPLRVDGAFCWKPGSEIELQAA